jgi:YegS/Rv2252/BmrU family lipid kinase
VSRRIAVLVNPSAAGGRTVQQLPSLRAELERLGADFRVVETSSAENARKEAADAADAGETVAAFGGDGLVGTLAGVMCGRESALAILPGGRGNDFARVLGIPADPVEAAAVAVNGGERLLDVGEVDGKTFVGIASLGLDSDANRIANDAKLVKGNLVYLYAALRALAQWKPATFDVTIDGDRHTFSGYSVAVANSKAYGGGMYLVPHAELDDGILDVMLAGQYSKLRALLDLPKAFKGTHVNNPDLTFLRGERIEISADRPFTVYADGDPIADLPVSIRVAKRVLRVLVPPGG